MEHIRGKVKLLNMIFDLTPKYVIKGALPEIKKKKEKLTCGTNLSEKPSVKNKHLTSTKEQP